MCHRHLAVRVTTGRAWSRCPYNVVCTVARCTGQHHHGPQQPAAYRGQRKRLDAVVSLRIIPWCLRCRCVTLHPCACLLPSCNCYTRTVYGESERGPAPPIARNANSKTHSRIATYRHKPAVNQHAVASVLCALYRDSGVESEHLVSNSRRVQAQRT